MLEYIRANASTCISKDGVHHFDENGLENMDDEPFWILNIHKEEIAFVKEWLKEWDNLHYV